MSLLFILSGAVAIIATVLVITQLNAVHALLYMIVSLLAVAFIFFLLGAPFIAALEVIVYAGAIMVLFVFVIMTLNLGPQSVDQERKWLGLRGLPGVILLTAILLGELIYILSRGSREAAFGVEIPPQQVSLTLFSSYLLGVELASILLLAGLVGAYHLGRHLK